MANNGFEIEELGISNGAGSGSSGYLPGGVLHHAR